MSFSLGCFNDKGGFFIIELLCIGIEEHIVSQNGKASGGSTEAGTLIVYTLFRIGDNFYAGKRSSISIKFGYVSTTTGYKL